MLYQKVGTRSWLGRVEDGRIESQNLSVPPAGSGLCKCREKLSAPSFPIVYEEFNNCIILKPIKGHLRVYRENFIKAREYQIYRKVRKDCDVINSRKRRNAKQLEN